MLAEMSNIFWPSGAVFLGLLFFFWALARLSKIMDTYKTALRRNADLTEQLYDFTVRQVQLETAVTVARADANSARKQLQHLTNAAIILAGNRRIRRKDMTDMGDYAIKFHCVQRRRHHLAASLEAQLSELLGTEHPQGQDGINLALTAMVRQAIIYSKEDPDFEPSEGNPHVPHP